MTDPDLHKKDPADPAQASEPVVSKPYVMPDDPEEGSVEALTKEVADARDKMFSVLELSGKQIGLMANVDLSGLAITLKE